MKRTTNIILIIIMLVLLAPKSFAQDGDKVYKVNLHGEINNVNYTYLVDSIKTIKNNGDGKLVIFDIDTYGGYIDYAERMKNIIVDMKIPTVAYVNNKAESAGVLLAVSADKLYMSPTATIGSAEPVPVNEKILSFWKSLLRDTAQFKGRNPEIVEAMADVDVNIPNVVAKGKLLNLSTSEAQKVNFIDGIANNHNELIDRLGYSNASLVNVDKSGKLAFADFLANPIVSTILLMIAVIAIVIELFFPTFGVATVISIVSFGLFFIGNLMIGNSNWINVVIFFVGCILIFVEMMIPGFGLPGITGIIAVIVGIVLSMGDITTGIYSISAAIVFSFFIGLVMVKLGYRSRMLNRLVLRSEDDLPANYEEKLNLLNKSGIVINTLRPSGTILIEDKKYDAITDGEFIEKGSDVFVSRVEGFKIFVRRK